MSAEPFTLTMADGHVLRGLRWTPTGKPALTLQIAHGMGEHIQRYQRIAEQLSDAGYLVYGNDHRGHGECLFENVLGYMGPDGWERCVDDAFQLHRHIRSQTPGVPAVLLGHSMGAMLAQQFFTRYGYCLDGLALSGSPGFAAPTQVAATMALVYVESRRHGPAGSSELLQNLLFDKSNAAFDVPGATGYEWLSRDSDEVQAYVDDPLCGFVLTPDSLAGLFAGAREAAKPHNLRCAPKRLPVYAFSGTDDPVHNEQKNLNRMLARYRGYGFTLQTQLYAGARHELFNETNRDEVFADFNRWLRQVCQG